MMKLNSNDIIRLILACKHYQEYTGSEYIWDEYEHLSAKLGYYKEENCPEECTEKNTSIKNQMSVPNFGGSGFA